MEGVAVSNFDGYVIPYRRIRYRKSAFRKFCTCPRYFQCRNVSARSQIPHGPMTLQSAGEVGWLLIA